MAACASCGTANPVGARFCNGCGAPLAPPPVPLVERKVVTALFCDLVGSTELADGADPEDVDRLLRTYHALAKRRIETYGGSVEKFIGDAVVGVFGVPTAHEDDAERAIRAGLRLVEEIATSDLGIHVRIGVMTGETLVRGDVDPSAGEGLATGDTLNIAARLQSHAPVDGVLVGEATFAACTSSFTWEDVGALALKGRAEPLHAWRAVAPVARGATELVVEHTPFVGREFELETIVRLFERARTTPALEVVTVIGDPGMGKSRLVREFARSVDALPTVVTWRSGRCPPYGDATGFAALAEIVRAHAGILDTDDAPAIGAKLDAVLTEPDEGLRAWLRETVGALVGLERSGDAGGQAERFTAWRRFLESIPRTGPAVLVIEDLHWAEPAFVEFLGELVARSGGLPLLLLVTARPELEQRHPSWLARSRRATVISLAGLPEVAMRELAAAALPATDPGLVAALLDRAAGSPLYAEQLAAMIRERGSGNELREFVIPASIQALLASRIDDLAPDERGVLRDAAVIGPTFWVGAVAAMGGRDRNGTELLIADLVRRELVRPVIPSSMAGETEFSVWHALVRDVAYAALPRGVRADRHARFAHWLETIAPDRVEDLAHHYGTAYALAEAADESPLVDDLREPAFRSLLVAGKRGIDVDARGAKVLLERASEIAAAGSLDQAHALSLVGDACRSLALHREASIALERAVSLFRDHGSLRESADALARLGHALYRLGDTRCLAMWDEALAVLEGLPPGPELLRELARKVFRSVDDGDPAAGIALAEHAVAVAEAAGLAMPAQLLLSAGTCRCMLGTPSGLDDMRRSIELSVERNEGWQAAAAYNNTASDVVLFDGPAPAIELVEQGLRWAETRGVEDAKLFLRGTAAELRFLSGDWERALIAGEYVERELDANEASSLLVSPRTVAAMMRTERGELSELGDLLDWLEEAIAGMTQPEWTVKTLAAVAAGRHALDEHESARRQLERLATAADLPMLDVGWALALPICSRVAAAEGRQDILERVVASYDPATPYGERARATAEAVRLEADGRAQDAADRYREVATAWRDLGVMPEHAHALAGLGRCLIAVGEAEEGLGRLREARSIWTGLRAAARVADIDREARTDARGAPAATS